MSRNPPLTPFLLIIPTRIWPTLVFPAHSFTASTYFRASIPTLAIAATVFSLSAP